MKFYTKLTSSIVEDMDQKKTDFFENKIRVQDAYGIHARPAAVLAQAAQGFASDVTLSWEGRTVDVKSILDLLSLAAPHQAELVLRCQGEDAAAAGAAMTEILKELARSCNPQG